MSDPNPIVEAIGKNGERLYMRRRSAKAYGLRTTDRRATDGHGRPLPAKPKVKIPAPPKPAEPVVLPEPEPTKEK